MRMLIGYATEKTLWHYPHVHSTNAYSMCRELPRIRGGILAILHPIGPFTFIPWRSLTK